MLRGLINAQADGRLLANQIASAVRGGYSYEYFQELATQVATLTPDQVKAQIDRVLQPSRSVSLVVGPAEGVKNVLTANMVTEAKTLPEVVHDEDD